MAILDTVVIFSHWKENGIAIAKYMKYKHTNITWS
jgi:hypothetical protein